MSQLLNAYLNDVTRNPVVRLTVRKWLTSQMVQRNIHSRAWTPNIQRHLFRDGHRVLSRTSPEHTSQLRDALSIRWFRTSVEAFQKKTSSENDDSKKDDKPDDPNQAVKVLGWMALTYIGISILSALLFPNSDAKDMLRMVTYKEFVQDMLTKGRVDRVVIRPEMEMVTIYLHNGVEAAKDRKDSIQQLDDLINTNPLQSPVDMRNKAMQNRFNNVYHMRVPKTELFEERLRETENQMGIPPEKQITVIYARDYDSSWIVLIGLAIIGLALYYRAKSGGMKLPNTTDMFKSMTRAKFTVVDPLSGGGRGVKFADVAGLQEAKVEIQEFVSYLKCPERYRTLGAKVPKGVLLLGPPGCGKTMLAKAVATEASVPFLSMNGSEFIEMIGGLGAARVRDLFNEARKRSPCIIYIDEIDAIGKKRAESSFGGSSGEAEQTLNQLLVEMDGMAGREGILMLASTNRADVLDKALLRAGRFDRHILIDYPTLIERKEIFEQHLKGIKLEGPPSTYSSRMAQLTPRFSGADIGNVCNEAALHAARDKKKVVTGDDMEYAIERVVGGTEKRSQIMNLEERRVVAYHESGHALVGWLLKHTDALLKVTIVPRTKGVLGFAMNVSSDQKLYSPEELFEKMCMALGGRVAESLMFNKISTGAQNDLEKVTKMAYGQIQQFGMDPVVGPISFPTSEEIKGEQGIGIRPYSKKLQNVMDIQARLLVGNAYKRTEEVLKQNMDKLSILAETLLKKETLNYNDVVNLIGPPPHGGKKAIDIIDFGPIPVETAKSQP
ncbi:Paraplegin [Halotydeus destructor]|nr:Paraplegin [Halotydeus destructor]